MKKSRLYLLLAAMATPLMTAQTPAPANDGNWPKEVNSDGVHLVIYQPQVDSWKKDRLEARAAVTVTQSGSPTQLFGIASLSARTEVDRENRLVTLEDLKVTKASFPSTGAKEGDLTRAVRDSLPNWPRMVSLDRLLADLSITNAETETESMTLKHDPPKIIFSTTPSVLIIIDGEPVYKPIQGTKYTRVINTPATLVFNPAATRFYLDGGTRWMTSTSLTGAWTEAANPPSDLGQVRSQLAQDEEKDPHDHAADKGAPKPTDPAPHVYVSTTPAELIQTRGEPQFSPIPKTQLLWVTNTDSDIFTYTKTQERYVLISGRWFQAKSFNGPWMWVEIGKLPNDFLKIPPDHPKGYVLASIPGTMQAKEAVISNQIPQTATVKRSEAKLTVRYDGPPQFKLMEGTSMEYAINTSSEVIHAAGRYYAVEKAVWFVSNSPTGPWVVADNIPAEIYTIPPSCPLFHDRYVYVYGSTPDLVYFGYTPGYLGAFVSDGVVVFGTGWWYPGWYGDYWYGWPWTWGFGFQFGYWTGGWFFRPVGGYWWYHDPGFMGRVYSEHWNTHWSPNDREKIRNNANVYNRWQGGAVAARSVARPAAAAAQHADVYAGKDGRVYEHTQNGWVEHDNAGSAKKVKAPPNVEQQRQSRSFGQTRATEFQNFGHSMGMPHSSFGGFRGGGGFGGGRRR